MAGRVNRSRSRPPRSYANNHPTYATREESRLDCAAALADRVPFRSAAVRVRDALGGRIMRFELAALSTAAQVASWPAHVGSAVHGNRDDSGHAVALPRRGRNARGQCQ